MGAIRIAVLAPCVKLHISDNEVMQAGTPGQVDFRSLATLLESSVLARWSQVRSMLIYGLVDLWFGSVFVLLFGPVHSSVR